MPKTTKQSGAPEEEPVNIYAMAEQAEAMGYNSIKRVADRLERIVHRNMSYLAYRRARGRRTSHDETTAEDCLILAQAIVFLERQDVQSVQGGINATTTDHNSDHRKNRDLRQAPQASPGLV